MIARSSILNAAQKIITVRSTNCFSTGVTQNKDYKLVVVGGGTGGCSTAAKFASKLGQGKVAVIEPNETHYYQPLWTLVGGGMNSLEDSARPMANVLPKKADWIKDRVVAFKPEQNKVVTEDGKEIGYEFLVVAMGLQLDYAKIKGLPEAFETPGVCSNYSPLYVNKTTKALKDFKGGSAVFTFPNTPIKCAGAPQKIMYIFEENARKKLLLKNYIIKFYSGIGLLFSSKYYADRLWEVATGRNISVNLKRNLIAIDTDKRELQFQNIENAEDIETVPYDFVHITPPMSTPDVLKNEASLVDAAGYLSLNKETLQHVKYPNIFGIGDCTSLPTSKTMAAVAGQIGILRQNLNSAMANKPLLAEYNGYTSCPLVTGDSTCIMAEFDYATNPIETFPFDQRKERKTMFLMKKHAFPYIYWNGMLKGYWEGPSIFRKILHFGMK